MPDNGPERTQMMQPGQPPQRPQGGGPGGGFDPTPSPAGGFQPPPPPGGFNPGSPPAGFQPGPQQGFQPGGQGGFNPGGPPQGQGGFHPGGPPQGGFGQQQGGYGQQQGGFGQQPGGYGPGGGAPGFGPASSDNDKMIAMAAGGSAILIGLIILILNLANIGYIFDASGFLGVLNLLLVLVGAGLAGGGVLIFMRNPLGPKLGFFAGVGYGVLALIVIIWATSVTGFFYGGGLVGMLLVAIPTVLCFLPQTKNYVNSGAGPQQGFGQQGGFGQQQQGGYGRPF